MSEEDGGFVSSGGSSEDESEELDLGFAPTAATTNGSFYPLTPQQPAPGHSGGLADENTNGAANTIPVGQGGLQGGDDESMAGGAVENYDAQANPGAGDDDCPGAEEYHGESGENDGDDVPDKIPIAPSVRSPKDAPGAAMSGSIGVGSNGDANVEEAEPASDNRQQGVENEVGVAEMREQESHGGGIASSQVMQGDGTRMCLPAGGSAPTSATQSGLEEEDLLDFEEDDLLDADSNPANLPDAKKPRLLGQASSPPSGEPAHLVPPPVAVEEVSKTVAQPAVVKTESARVDERVNTPDAADKSASMPTKLGSITAAEGGQKRKRELIPAPPSKDLDGFSVDSFNENLVITVAESGKSRQIQKEGKFDEEKWRNLVSSDGQQQYSASTKEKECHQRPNRKDDRIVTFKTSKVEVFEMDTQLNLSIRIDGEDPESYVMQKNSILPDPRYVDDADYSKGLERAEKFLDHNGKQQLMSHSTSIRHSVLSELGELDLKAIPQIQKYIMGRLKECRKSTQGRTIRDECREIKDDKFYDLGCRRLNSFVPSPTREKLLKCSVPKRRELLISFGLVPFPIIEPAPADYFVKLLEEDAGPSGRQKPALALPRSDFAKSSRSSQPGRESARKEKPPDGRSSRELDKGGSGRERPVITDSRRSDSRRRPSRDLRRDDRSRDGRRDADDWKARRDVHHHSSRRGLSQGRDRGRRRDSPPRHHHRRDHHHSPPPRPLHRHRSPMRHRDLSPHGSHHHHHHHHQPPPPPPRRMDDMGHHGSRDGMDTRVGHRGASDWVTAGMGPLTARKQPSPPPLQAPITVAAPFQMDLNPIVAGLPQQGLQGGLVGTGLSLNDQQAILLAQQQQQQQHQHLLNAQNVQQANIRFVNRGNMMDIAATQHTGLPINTINHTAIAQQQQSHQGLRGQGQLVAGFNLMTLPQPQPPQHRIHLKLNSGGCLCPDPARKDDPNPFMRLNEDAFYICENALAVADGLGGTLQHGVSSAEYARALAETAAKAMDRLIKESNGHPWTPKVAIEYAYTQIEPQGASTLCLLAFDANQSILHVGKVGDGGYVVLRPLGLEDMEVVSPWLPFKNLQEHPIGLKSTNYLTSLELRQRIGGFHPQHAIESQVLLQEGDIVIAATDGFFDVIYLHGDKGKPLRRQIRKVGLEPMMLAQQLTDLARQFAATRTTDCPICEEGRRANDERTASGVQPDDIAVVAAHVVRS